MKQARTILIITVFLSLMAAFCSSAASWQHDGTGYWYQNDDATYPKNSWLWIDGNEDGIAERYYFDENGYLLVNTTTPDQCTVDTNGAWTVDGVVQTQTVAGANVAVMSITDSQSNSQAVQETQASRQSSAAVSGTVSGISSIPFDGYTIVVNTNTKKYHKPGCASVKDIKTKNKAYADNADTLNTQGYAACKRCH